MIVADDGARFRFVGREWRSQAAQPRLGVRVDFVAGSRERRPRCTKSWHLDALRRLDARVGFDQSLAAQGLDERYGGLYRSSDEGMVLGFCAGLAHKTDAPLWAIRVGMLIAVLFVIGLLYFVAIFLPKRPTRGVPHPS